MKTLKKTQFFYKSSKRPVKMHHVYYTIFGKIAQPYSGAVGIKVSEGKIIRLQKVLHPGILRSINTKL